MQTPGGNWGIGGTVDGVVRLEVVRFRSLPLAACLVVGLLVVLGGLKCKPPVATGGSWVGLELLAVNTGEHW